MPSSGETSVCKRNDNRLLPGSASIISATSRIQIRNKKCPRMRTSAAETKTSSYPVQASALQGGEIALGHALGSTCPVDRLWMSPSLRGSNPYPCGSLTYRGGIHFVNIICVPAAFCKLFHKLSAKNMAEPPKMPRRRKSRSRSDGRLRRDLIFLLLLRDIWRCSCQCTFR